MPYISEVPHNSFPFPSFFFLPYPPFLLPLLCRQPAAPATHEQPEAAATVNRSQLQEPQLPPTTATTSCVWTQPCVPPASSGWGSRFLFSLHRQQSFCAAATTTSTCPFTFFLVSPYYAISCSPILIFLILIEIYQDYGLCVDCVLILFNLIMGNSKGVILEHEIIMVWFRDEITSCVRVCMLLLVMWWLIE